MNGRTIHHRSTTAVLSVAALALCAGAATCRPAPSRPAPRKALSRPAVSVAKSAIPVLQAIAAAANKGEAYKTWRYATSGRGEVFTWIRPGGMMSAMFRPDPWKPALLEPPFTNSAGPLAVYYAWHAPESDGDHIHPLVKTPQGWRVAPEVSERDTQGYRIRHHDLAVTIDNGRRRASVIDNLTLERGANAKPVVFLRLSDDFRVRSVSAGDRPVPFRQAGGVVAVRVPAGKSVKLKMGYDGRVVHRAFSSIEPNYALLNAYFWPSLGRLPATSNTTITTPAGWTAVSQGNLASREVLADRSVWHYINQVPANYLSIAAGKYQVTQRKVGDVTLSTYLLSAEPGFSNSVLDALALALPYFERRFGPFPFKQYSIMDGGNVMGFVALEGYSFATYGTVTLTPYIVAHELSHTWWGGLVPNTYLRSWWNEAFASYSDDAFSRMKNGVTARHPTDKVWWPPYSSISGDSLATARETSNIDAIAYKKGMVVLRLMEDEMGGEEPFDRFLQTFVRENRDNPDPGWPDVQRTVEKVTGRKWGTFFKQWVERPGWPQLALQDVAVQRAGEGYEVTGSIHQEGEPYRLSVTLRLLNGGAPAKDVVVRLDHGVVPFRIVSTVRPEKLLLDPDLDVPRRMGMDDVASFGAGLRAALSHSREEHAGMGGM